MQTTEENQIPEQASDPRSNDAVWARFYRDGATLGEIAKEFGGSIYTYSPWLVRPLMQSGMEMVEGKNAKIERLQGDLKRVTDHLDTWAGDHSEERTADIDAAIYCARQTLAGQ